MMEFIDIHSHILPGVDDGARNMEETLKMAEIAYKEGIRTIFATSHYRPGRFACPKEKLRAKLSKTQEEISRFFPELKLVQGNEIYYGMEALEAIQEKRICTLAGSRYILVEFSVSSEFGFVRDGLYKIILEGYRPVLAHVERYHAVCKKLDQIAELLELGVGIQVNADSITGESGYQLKQISRKLLKRDYVHFVATDAHSSRSRTPRMQACASYLTRKYGEDYTKALMFQNPLKIIWNEEL
ncbi:hypothetical protein KTH89_03185 [Lachnospiraceae bacterium ASD5720]|uniref:protein-tyrosine-phosphatase n=2 Tax=Diplocloster agilis TaxID=2850323 RepID=A0A949NH32_9FIRM|nr:hypothetical protein [Diplocloster agilis]